MRGFFLDFENLDGSSSQPLISLLADRLTSAGRNVHTLCQPGGTPIGEEISQAMIRYKDTEQLSTEADLLLTNASRAQMIREIIQPAIGREEIVLCDGFYDFNGTVNRHSQAFTTSSKMLFEFATAETRPDLTFVLSSVSMRNSTREGVSMPSGIKRKLESVLAINWERVASIDATRPRDEITKEIWSLTSALLSEAKGFASTDYGKA